MATEKRLVDVNEVKQKLRAVREWFVGHPSSEQDKLAQAVAKLCIEEIDKIKPVDAVEVVRCVDCKFCRTFFPKKEIGKEARQVWYCDLYRCNRKTDEYCSDGERRGMHNNGC